MKQATILLKVLGLLSIAEYSAAQFTNPKGDFIRCFRKCLATENSRRVCYRKCMNPLVKPQDETLPLKEGEQCKSTFTNCIEEGSCAIGQKCSASCSSGQRIQPCEEGLKCIDDPNDTKNGFCKKDGILPEEDCGCLCKCCKQAGVPKKCLYEHTKIANEISVNGTHKALTTIESKECNKHMNQLRTCEAECLKPPCEVSEWTDWSACAAACGSGIVTRRRYVLNPAFAARSCPDLTMSKQCESTRNCCEWNEWSHWSECSQTCGGGQRVRKRSLKYTPKEHPGFGPGFGFQSVISCDNSLSSRIQFDACNKNYCPGTQGPTNVTIHEPSSRAAIPIDCKIKRIASPCSKTCTDHGSPPTKVITSRIVQQPSFGGRPCPRVSRIERQCFAPPCPPPDCRDKTDCISCCCCRHHIPPKCLEEELGGSKTAFPLNQTHQVFSIVKSKDCHKFTTDLNQCKLECHNDRQHDNDNYQCQNGESGATFGPGYRKETECVRAQSLEICEKCQHTNQCKAPYKCCPITKLCVLDCNTNCKGSAKAICHPPCTDQENPKSCQCLSSDFPLNWGGPTCRDIGWDIAGTFA